jgi:catechol 2,3-dioxygenase-like lactoylglutathione lyase family enzyme
MSQGYAFRKLIPNIRVKSLDTSIPFYTEKLGFKLGGRHGDVHASVFLGSQAECNIYLYTEHENEAAISPCQTMIMIAPPTLDHSVDVLAKELESKGVRLAESVQNKPWGYRQFRVLDPDGKFYLCS